MKKLIFDIFHVGHGDSTLVEFPGGKKFGIIDCNNPSWTKGPPVMQAVSERLKTRKKLEVVFVCVSHPHSDHVKGISNLLRAKNVSINQLWHPLPDIEDFVMAFKDAPKNDKDPDFTLAAEYYHRWQIKEFITFYRKLQSRIGDKNIVQMRGIQILDEIEGVQIYCVNPIHDFTSEYKSAIKNSGCRFDKIDRSLLDNISLAFLFVYGENALLYASDMQKEQWYGVIATMRKNKVREYFPLAVAKASHHGGPRSSYERLWKSIMEKDARIIVSGGSKGHPHQKFISTVERTSNTLYCTGMPIDCGLKSQPNKAAKYNAEKWLDLHGEFYEYGQPCHGHIKVVLPEKGHVSVEPSCLPFTSGKCSPRCKNCAQK